MYVLHEVNENDAQWVDQNSSIWDKLGRNALSEMRMCFRNFQIKNVHLIPFVIKISFLAPKIFSLNEPQWARCEMPQNSTRSTIDQCPPKKAESNGQNDQSTTAYSLSSLKSLIKWESTNGILNPTFCTIAVRERLLHVQITQYYQQYIAVFILSENDTHFKSFSPRVHLCMRKFPQCEKRTWYSTSWFITPLFFPHAYSLLGQLQNSKRWPIAM